MNHISTFLFILLPIFCFAQKSDFIIKNNGEKVLGEIKEIDLSRKGYVRFKSAKSGLFESYEPDKLQAWKKGKREYHTKLLALSPQKTIPVFMELLSDKEGLVILYEYDTDYERDNKTRLFLDRRSELTEVKVGKFKKQLQTYFEDKPNVVAMIEDDNREISATDILALVDEYNDVFEEDVALFHESGNNHSSDFLEATRDENGEKRTSQVKIWDFDDMLLSSEDAANKLLRSLEEKLRRIQEEHERNIVKNTELGMSFFEQKFYYRALPFLEEAIRGLKTSTRAESIRLKPEILSMLAVIYINNKDYEKAADLNSQALEIWALGEIEKKDIGLVYQTYLNQAKIFKSLEVTKKSNHKQWYDRIVAPSEEDWAAQMALLGLRPIVHATLPQKTEDYNLAFLCLQKAKNLLVLIPQAERIPKQVNLELQLGALYFGAGGYPLAKAHYETGLNLMLKNYDRRHPMLAETQRIISEIYLAERLYTEALDFIEKAEYISLNKKLELDQSLLDNISQIPFPFELLNAITTKGIILYEQNKKNPSESELKKVLAHYAMATTLLHELRKTHRREGSEHSLSQATFRFSQHAIVICNALYELTKKEMYLEEAYLYAELTKSAVLYETVHDLKSTVVSGIPREEIVKENGLKVQIAYLKSEVFYELQRGEALDKKRLFRMESKITEVTKEHNKLLKNFEKEYPEYYALKYNYRGIDLKALQKELSANEVFLQYVATDSFIYTLAIGKNDIKSRWVDLEIPLHKMTTVLQSSLHLNRPDNYYRYGEMLYEAVIGDLAPFIANKKLIISPDAELHYIPFGVLPTPQSKVVSKGKKLYSEVHYMIEDHPICYNYSASMYALSKHSRVHKSTKTIATWAPNFSALGKSLSEKGFPELDPLPGAQEEAQAIAALFNTKAFIEEDASEAAFKSIAEQYSVLHIATHGVLNDLNPIYSSLVMSSGGKEDGILHAFELYNMRLNADLAVLSACNSGMGHLTKEEGVVSIARGFSYAGVPNIVMSKWPVSDWATAYLMHHFYLNIKLGMPKDEALQLAKIEFIKEHKDKLDMLPPFYWGGFVLSGNSAPIKVLANSNYQYWLLGILTSLVLMFLLYRKFGNKKAQKTAA